MILLDGLRQTLAQSDAAPAILYGKQRLSRRALGSRAEILRRRLETHGVHPGDRVAVLMPNHPDFVVSWLAVLARGAILVPLNPLYTQTELAKLLHSASPRLLLCLPETSGLALASVSTLNQLAPDRPLPIGVLEEPHPEPDLARIRQSVLAGLPEPRTREQLEQWLSRPEATSFPLTRWLLPELEEDSIFQALEAVPVTPEMPAVILYTSGTTGAPKGAVLTHQNLGSNARFVARTWFKGTPEGPLSGHPPARVLACLPLCHNFGLNVTIDSVLLAGGTMVLLPRYSAVEAIRALARFEVTAMALVPAMVQAMLHNPELSRWFESRALNGLSPDSPVRLLISGGAALPGALREQVSARFPGIALRDTYGLSEASLVACTHPAEGGEGGAMSGEVCVDAAGLAPSGLTERLDARGKPGTVGRPVDETQLQIVDDVGAACAPGVVGEIQVRGPGVMPGYWGQPPVEGPYWLATGDLGLLDLDGDLTVVERKKDLIIHGGYKVYPLEVEAVLYQHPAVLEAAVFGVPDARMGEKVVACVSLKPVLTDADGLGAAPASNVTPAQLQSHCRKALAEFKVPAIIQLLETLPKGSTGKILRRLLREGWGNGLQ